MPLHSGGPFDIAESDSNGGFAARKGEEEVAVWPFKEQDKWEDPNSRPIHSAPLHEHHFCDQNGYDCPVSGLRIK